VATAEPPVASALVQQQLQGRNLRRFLDRPLTGEALPAAMLPAPAAAALGASEASEREQAELLRRHVVPAPFAGVVARRLTDVGEWVSRGTPVIELVATDRVRLDVQAPQERFAAIREEAVVQVFADSLGGESLPGRVVARVPVAFGGSTGGGGATGMSPCSSHHRSMPRSALASFWTDERVTSPRRSRTNAPTLARLTSWSEPHRRHHRPAYCSYVARVVSSWVVSSDASHSAATSTSGRVLAFPGAGAFRPPSSASV
jgi:pyruvate/2-oxoglutarate dehydrogenase complex dihydrolipoamide acyltransferase (E2) component